MLVYRVSLTNPWTGEEHRGYLVSGEEKAFLGGAAKFEPEDVEPAEFLENKTTRSLEFSDWLLDHRRKAEAR
jgi:hypothetical protein